MATTYPGSDWFVRFEDVIEYRKGKDGYQEMIIPNWNTFEEFIEAEIKRGFEAGKNDANNYTKKH